MQRRTLRIVARWADIWDALRTEPDEWKRKNEVLLEHCANVGRDADEITRSAHVMTPADADPRALAEEAAKRFEAGLDLAIFSLRAPFDTRQIEPLANALQEL